MTRQETAFSVLGAVAGIVPVEIASLSGRYPRKIVDRHPMSRLDELLPFAYVKSAPIKAVA